MRLQRIRTVNGAGCSQRLAPFALQLAHAQVATVVARPFYRFLHALPFVPAV